MHPDEGRFIDSLTNEDIETARLLGLNPAFKLTSQAFIESGKPMKYAIEYGSIEFVRELMDNGFPINNKMLLLQLKTIEKDKIMMIIGEKLYNASDVGLISEILTQRGFQDVHQDLEAQHPNWFAIDVKERRLQTLELALRYQDDDLAQKLIINDPAFMSQPLIELAVTNACIDYLGRIYTGNFTEGLQFIRSRKTSKHWNKVEAMSPNFKVANIVNEFLNKHKAGAVQKLLLGWPRVQNEEGLLEVLKQHDQQELAATIFSQNTKGVLAEDFLKAFRERQFDLCVGMAKIRAVSVALHKPKIQEQLINLLQYGETCLQAIQILNNIGKQYWHLELTKELCSILTTFAKKRDEIIFCKAPLLFVVLVAEFMTRISEASLQHQNRCLGVAEEYKQLGVAIEDAIKDERELRYHLLQKDSHERNVLFILSHNRFYELLENDDIGVIVNKLWNGSKKNYGILEASTIYKSFHSPSGSEEAMQFSKPMDATKPYLFHYDQWTESCSTRFMAQAFSIAALVTMYMLLIIEAIEESVLDDVMSYWKTSIYMLICQVFIVGILIERILHFAYDQKTGIGVHVDVWTFIDVLMFAIMIVLIFDVHDSANFEYPLLYNAMLHSIQLLLIYLKFTSVLASTKRFGPILRMIYLMIGEVVNFFTILFCLGICSAAIFTALFNHISADYINFSTSIRTLFSSALGGFNLNAFNEHRGIGALFLGVYLLLANVMLLNLLIALLSNVYSDLIVRVDGEHRAVVISYFKKWFWNDNYGMLICMPSPITYIIMLLSPFVLFSKNPRKWNRRLTKIIYPIHGIFPFLLFLLGSIMYWPILYIKGFAIYGKTGYISKKKSNVGIFDVQADSNIDDGQEQLIKFSYRKSLIWGLIGFWWLGWVVIRDCKDFWKIMYMKVQDITDDEQTKLSQFITSDTIKTTQRVLDMIQAEEIPLQQFVDLWQIIDYSNEEFDDLETRKGLSLEFHAQFAESTSDPIINLSKIRRVLPKRPGNQYDGLYLTRVSHVNIPWFTKALKKYQENSGGGTLGNLSLPSNFGQKTNISLDQILAIDVDIKYLEDTCEQIFETSRGIKKEMDEQAVFLGIMDGGRGLPGSSGAANRLL